MGTDQGATNNSLHTQKSAPFSLNKEVQTSGKRDGDGNSEDLRLRSVG